MKYVLAELSKLAWYLVVVTLGITLQGFVILPTIYAAITRKLPFGFIASMGPALATAFMGIHCPSRRWASLFFKGRGAARVEPASPPPVALF